MAITGFTVTVGAPGAGSGLIIRDALAAGLSASWTVGALTTFSSGTTLFTAWAVTHTTGPQILFVMCEGTSASANNCIAAVARTNEQFSSATARSLWFAVDPDSGAGDTFADGLYVNSLSPFDTAFWSNVVNYTKAYSLETVQNGRTGVELAFMEEDDAGTFFLQVVGKTTTAAYSNSRSVLQLGECVEQGSIGLSDHFDYPAGMIIGWQSETNAAGNDLQKKLIVAANNDGTEYASVLTTDDPCDLDTSTDGQDLTRVLTVSNDPDAAGDAHAQPILILNKQRRFAGRIKKRIALSLRDAQTIKIIKSNADGDYYIAMDGLAVAWNESDVASF